MARDGSSKGTSSSTRGKLADAIPAHVQRKLDKAMEERGDVLLTAGDQTGIMHAEANVLFQKISKEMLSRGTALGSLKYLREQISALGAQLDHLIEKIERAKKIP